MSNGQDTIIKITGLEKTYITGMDRLTIIKSLDMEVASGTKVVVVGESGSGKSTLLNIIGGLDTPTEGQVEVGPYAVHRLPEDQMAE